MKLLNALLLATFAGESLASWGFGKNAYNKWHETELERWLSDHDIDYPKPADRKDLEKIVQDNWQTRIVDSYNNWEVPQLQSYLGDTGKELDHKSKADKNWLVQQVKQGWHETEKTAESAYDSVKDWIFDAWTESQLKTFLDRHRIPNPTPSNHETLAAEASKNYKQVAEKLGESTSYPGNWLYESWSDSDLKAWLDTHGYPAPQLTTRDKLIASVRRNSRLASVKTKKAKNSTKNVISDTVFDTWSESKLKEFLDKNNVRVPQGSTKNELLALARRNKAYLTGDSAYQTATSAYSDATSSVSSATSQATDTAKSYGQHSFDKIIEQWSATKLKAYLDSRGVPVPQNSKRDELLASVRLHKHKAATGYGAWTFDTWTYDNLQKLLEQHGQKISNDASASREKLAAQAWSYMNGLSGMAGSATETASASGASVASDASAGAASAASKATDAAGYVASKASDVAGGAASKASDVAGGAASKATDAAGYAGKKVGEAASQAGGSAADAGSKVADAAADRSKQAYASLTSALSQATGSAKNTAFETWSDSDLKAYLDSYGIQIYQGSTRNEWIAMARRNAHYFRYGGDDQGIGGYFSSTVGQINNFISSIFGKAGEKVQDKANVVKDEATTRAQKAYAGAKNEL